MGDEKILYLCYFLRGGAETEVGMVDGAWPRALCGHLPPAGRKLLTLLKICECADRLSASEAQRVERAEPGEAQPLAGILVKGSLKVAWPPEKASPRKGRAGGPD